MDTWQLCSLTLLQSLHTCKNSCRRCVQVRLSYTRASAGRKPTGKQPLWVVEFNAGLATEHQILDCVVDSHLNSALRHDLQDRGSVACISAPGIKRVTTSGALMCLGLRTGDRGNRCW